MTRKRNPFAELLSENTTNLRARHPTDDPGHDYDQTSAEAEERTRSSGVSSPSEPRRPGGNTRQAPRRRHSDAPLDDEAEPLIPGEILYCEGDVVINEGLEVTTLRVTNTSDRPIQIGSHFHFAEVNAALESDRDAAWGKRLAILSGGTRRPVRSCRVGSGTQRAHPVARTAQGLARSRASASARHERHPSTPAVRGLRGRAASARRDRSRGGGFRPGAAALAILHENNAGAAAVAAKVMRVDLFDVHAILARMTDDGGRIAGIITHDDALDVMEAEATEDFHKVGTVGKIGSSVAGATIPMLYRARIGWLVFGTLFRARASPISRTRSPRILRRGSFFPS